MDEGNTTCVQCEREISGSLTWCPYCGAEQGRTESRPLPSEEIAAELDLEPIDQPPATAADPFTPTRPTPLPADSIRTGPNPAAPVSGGSRAAVIGLGLLVLIGAIAAWFFLLRDDNRGDVSLMAIGPGDCWNDPDGIDADTELADVPEVPCIERHDNEVFAIIELADGGSSLYPGQDEVAEMAYQGCLAEFEAYVGVPYGSSPFEIYTLFPTSSSWLLENDRGVVCSAYLLDGTIPSGSLRDNPELRITPIVDVAGIGDCPGLADSTIVVAQGYIDFYDSLTEEELETVFDTFPPEFVPLYKAEALVGNRAFPLGCSFEDLNMLVQNRAGSLTSTTEVGASFVEQVATYGFFSTD